MGAGTRIEQVEQCIRQLPQETGENPHTEDKQCCIFLAAYLTPLPELKEQVNREYNHRIVRFDVKIIGLQFNFSFI